MAAGREGELVERDHALHRLADQREQRALAVVEEQRLVGIDQELVEGEAGRPDLGQEGRQAIDLVGDLGDVRLHGFSTSRSLALKASAASYATQCPAPGITLMTKSGWTARKMSMRSWM